MKIVRFGMLLGAALWLAACAQPANISRMVVHEPASGTLIDPAFSDAIAVGSVTGGEETSPLWTSEVSSGDFAKALGVSLSNRGLLARTKPSPFTLDADLLEMDQPLFGFDITVTSHVTYSLVRTATKETVLTETIVTPYTATVDDAFLGVRRLQLANEGSVRENVRQFLDRLYKP